jgi:fatty-acyl-CoA synthase
MNPAGDVRVLVARATQLTLADVLRAQAIIRPAEPAIIAGDAAVSYGELDALSDRLAAGLVAMGVKRGDRLAVLSRNSLRYALIYHAASKAGIAVAALNWRSAPAELERAIALVEPAAIAVSDDLAAVCGQVAPDIPTLLLDRDDTGGPVRTYGDLAAASPERFEVDPEDIVSIVFTSGTTGDPKAVAISHRALIARAGVIGIDWSLEPGDAFIGWAPLFHISSSDYLFTTPVLSGVFIVMDGFDAASIAALLRARKVGWMFLVPGTFERIAEALGDEPLPPGRVKVVGVMADLATPAIVSDLTRLTGAPFLNSFGMTETGLLPCSPSFVRSKEDTVLTLPKKQSALCNLRLVGEDGVDAAPGEPGEMWVRSQTLFSGYWKNDDATRQAFAEGWYHTGDVMRRNGDGTLQYVGRRSGMIKSGGENIYPAEIERALMRHPAVAEAAAVGVPHPRWGETPIAFVALDAGVGATPDELRDFLARHIASYKIPSAIRMIALGDFPRNVTGKVDRKALLTRFGAGEED